MQASFPALSQGDRAPSIPLRGWFFRLSLMVKHRAVDAGIQVQLLGPGPTIYRDKSGFRVFSWDDGRVAKGT